MVGKGEFVFSWPCLLSPSVLAKPKGRRRAMRCMAANITADLRFQGNKHFGKGERQQLGSPLSEKIQYEFNYIARESMQGSDITNENPQSRFAGCRTASFCRTALFFFFSETEYSQYTSTGHVCCLQSLQWWGPHLPAMDQQVPRTGAKKWGGEIVFLITSFLDGCKFATSQSRWGHTGTSVFYK